MRILVIFFKDNIYILISKRCYCQNFARNYMEHRKGVVFWGTNKTVAAKG